MWITTLDDLTSTSFSARGQPAKSFPGMDFGDIGRNLEDVFFISSEEPKWVRETSCNLVTMSTINRLGSLFPKSSA